MAENGIYINPVEGYVYIQGDDLIRQLLTGEPCYTLNDFSQIAHMIVKSRGPEFNITDPGEPEDWVLTTNPSSLELLLSYLDPIDLDLLELSRTTVDDLDARSLVSIVTQAKVTLH